MWIKINFLLIDRYKKLIKDIYTETKNEEISGFYLNQQKGEGHPEPR